MEAELKKIMEERWKEFVSDCVPINVIVAISGSPNCSRPLLDFVYQREGIFRESSILSEILLNGARVGNINVLDFLEDTGLLQEICHKDIWEAQRIAFGEFYDRIAHMHSSERRLHCEACRTFI